jgi:hypothetical protein
MIVRLSYVLCVFDLIDNLFSFTDYAFPYIILVLSLVTLAVYMSASEIQVTALSFIVKRCLYFYNKIQILIIDLFFLQWNWYPSHLNELALFTFFLS